MRAVSRHFQVRIIEQRNWNGIYLLKLAEFLACLESNDQTSLPEKLNCACVESDSVWVRRET